jgi:hypothetical protein
MALTRAVRQLQKEEKRLQAQLEQVSNALQVLNHLFGKRRRRRSANGRRKPRRPKFSQATRNRMAAAQRARWAKLKARRVR